MTVLNRDYLSIDRRKFTIGSAYTITYDDNEFPAILAKATTKALTFGVCTKSGVLQIVLTLDAIIDNDIEFDEIYAGKPADEDELKKLCSGNKSYEMNDYSIKVDEDETDKPDKKDDDDDFYDSIDLDTDDM